MYKNCIFCKIVSGEIPSKKIFEDEEIVAFNDISPKAPVHILVIPKRHIPRLADAEESDAGLLGRLQLVAAKIAKEQGVGEGFRLINFNGESAGQTVFHLHYHIRGGWKGERPEDI